MTNINLATSSLPQKQGLPYKKGIIGIIIILAILAGGYGWISFESKKTMGQIAAVNGNYAVEYQKLTTGNKEVVEFQNRLTLVKGLLADKNKALESLLELEKSVLPEAYLTAYSLEKGQLKLSAIENNFDILARQISSFKKSSYFSAVSVGKSTLNGANKVASETTLNIN